MWVSQKNVDSRRTQGHQPPSPQGPKAAGSIKLSLPKSARILKRSIYKEISRSHQRYYGNVLIICYRSSDEPKLGITVFRQFGKAIRRNYFKRLVREAFRLCRASLPPVEMVIMPQNKVKDFSLNAMMQDFLEFCGAQSTTTKSC